MYVYIYNYILILHRKNIDIYSKIVFNIDFISLFGF